MGETTHEVKAMASGCVKKALAVCEPERALLELGSGRAHSAASLRKPL